MAATSFARFPYRPLFSALSSMCSYMRCSFEPTPWTFLPFGIVKRLHPRKDWAQSG